MKIVTLRDIFIALVFAALGAYLAWGLKPAVHIPGLLGRIDTIRAPEQTHAAAQAAIHDTTTPHLSFFAQFAYSISQPTQSIVYLSLAHEDSIALSSIYLVNRLSLHDGVLTSDAVKLQAETYMQQSFSVDNDFDLTTNSSGVHIVQRKVWLRFDGLGLGARWNGGTISPLLTARVTLIGRIDIAPYIGPSQYGVDLTYQLIR